MQVKGIVWAGTRTPAFDQMREFADRVLGLEVYRDRSDFLAFKLPSGELFEIFRTTADGASCPVVGFLVDDVEAARTEMERHGVHFLEPVRWSTTRDNSWCTFVAPDGHTYEITTGIR